jgi:hypothetical protein
LNTASEGTALTDATILPKAIATASAVHHVGMSVANIDDALAFWERFLGVPARWRTTLDQPYLGKIVGIPGVSINAAFVDLPGEIILELLEYQPDKRANPEATANPGNIHSLLGGRRRPSRLETCRRLRRKTRAPRRPG